MNDNAASALNRVADMVAVLRMRRDQVARAEKELAEAKKELRRIEEEDFPELMRECELKEVTLADGTSLRLVDDIHCSISEERKPSAFAWLRANGFGGLIKTAIEISFGKGEEAEMKEAEAAIVAMGRNPERVEGVHPQTLKAFIREQREKGKSPPDDTFGIVAYNKVVVKEPKGRT